MRSLDGALAWIERWVALNSAQPHAAVVGITGPAGAGKSTLAGRVSACVVATDDYLPDYEAVPRDERDDPRHADLDALAGHLDDLRRGRAVRAPVWSFHEHRRVGQQRIEPGSPVVCEGLFALHESLGGVVDLAVYVQAPREVRWARWEAIERAGLRGMGVDRAREHFESVAEPAFEQWAGVYRARARLVVVNE